MSADIQGRLRCLAGIHPHLNQDAQKLLKEAADRIDELERDVRSVLRVATQIKIRDYGQPEDR